VARALAVPARAGALTVELDDVTGLSNMGGDTLELEAVNSAERTTLGGFIRALAIRCDEHGRHIGR